MTKALPPAITDIHNHLLPAVDDGAQSLEESIRHLRILHGEGVQQLAVSPHLFGWLTDEGGFLQRYQELERAFHGPLILAENGQSVGRRSSWPPVFTLVFVRVFVLSFGVLGYLVLEPQFLCNKRYQDGRSAPASDKYYSVFLQLVLLYHGFYN